MNITITSVNTDDYLIVTSVGSVENTNDLNSHAELVYKEISKYNNKKILADFTKTTFPLDFLPYYDLVKFYESHLPAAIRFLKIAAVISTKFEEPGKFWETVAVNRGFEYHSFTSMEEAHRWLIQ